MKKQFCFLALTAMLLFGSKSSIAQVSCDSFIVTPCGTADIISKNSTLIVDTLIQPYLPTCYYICNNGFLELQNNPNAIGNSSIYIEGGGVFIDESFVGFTQTFIVAKAPASIYLHLWPASIKCDSGVSVFLNGLPADPYPCSCSHISFDYSKVASCVVGVSEVNSEIPNLSAFPNPTSTTITLSLPSTQNTILSIFNLLGEKVKEEKVTGKQVTMDVSSLPQGLYVVRMEDRVVGKFVKE